MISIGPLALALERLGALVAFGLFLGGSRWVERRAGGSAERKAFTAVIAGMIAARAGFVIGNWSAFARHPLDMLAFWQGGFSWISGVAVAAVTLVLTMRRSRALPPLLLLLAGITALWFAADCLLLTPAPRPLPSGVMAAGFDGAVITPEQLRGRPFVINLWATWCPPCRREMPMMVEEAAHASMPVLLINQGEDRATVLNWLQRRKLAGDAVRLDPQGTTSVRLEAGALPTTLFIDANGMIRAIHRGEISRAGLLSGMKELEETL